MTEYKCQYAKNSANPCVNRGKFSDCYISEKGCGNHSKSEGFRHISPHLLENCLAIPPRDSISRHS